MPEHDEKKEKKSIDEILSDLNHLLNRMPQILEGIKLPDMKPIDFDKMAIGDIKKEEEPAPSVFTPEPVAEEIADASQSGPDLGEAIIPAEKEPEIPAETGDSFVKLDEITKPPAGEEKDLSQGAAEGPADSRPETAFEPDDAGHRVLENTNDFGAPDIETLLKMAAAAPLGPQARKEEPLEQPEPAATTAEIKKEIPDGEAVPTAESEPNTNDGGAMSEEKKEGLGGGEEEIKIDISDALQDGEGKSGEPQQPAENAPREEEKTVIFNVEDLILVNDHEQAQAEQPVQEQPAEESAPEAEKTVVFNVEDIIVGDDQPQAAEPQSEQPREEPVQEIQAQPEAQAEVFQTEETAAPQESQEEAQPAPAEDIQAAGLSLELPGQEPVLQAEPAAEQSSAEPGEPNLSISIGGDAASSAPAESMEEKTLFVEPKSDIGEATVVFTSAQAGPAETSRSPVAAGDFQASVDRQPPENVLPERVKTAGFLYSSDTNSIFNVLNSLDEICLSSNEKPMFVKRGFVLNYTAEMSANYLTQRVSETGSLALLAVGEFPEDKVYELETVFNTAGVLFKKINPAEFSKSEMIDIVMELVLK